MSIPAPFDYHPVQTVDEAIALLKEYGDEAKVLAGGHSLLPTMKLRLSQPSHLIDIGRINGLSYIREEGDVIAVGALTTYTSMARSELLRRHFARTGRCRISHRRSAGTQSRHAWWQRSTLGSRR